MNDAAWLPSAIMQTTAALIGIFAVVYVLCVQGLAEKASKFCHIFRHYRYIDVFFFILLFLGILTIYSNYLWLSHLVVGIERASDELVAIIPFHFVLIFIVLYSLIMIEEYREKE
jgi:hypothetical protein